MKNLILLFFSALAWGCCETPKHEISLRPSEYVTTLVGTQSDYSLSTGNTYPAVALPWGMNFWTPQTGKMGDGWAYTYGSHTIRGLKQTHQPSPWINDYGQFSIMPVRGKDKVDENARQSWFSHQSETAKPYYYSVYLADHDVVAEMAPTDRAAVLRFTFPESDESGVVIDAFDRGSQVKVMPDSRTVVGYTTRNSGGVPDNFRNWFVIRFDKPIESSKLFDGEREIAGSSVEGGHALAAVYFTTRRGEQVTARVASSFISEEQALRNLETEVGDADFETVKARAQERWDEVLGRIEVSGGTEEQYRTFYSCLYRSTLFPRKFYEIYRHGFLGYVPVSVPAAEPGLPVGQRRDSGRVGQHLPRERLPARMGLAGPPRLHGGQQFGFRSCRCDPERSDARRGCRHALRGDACGTRQGASHGKLHRSPRTRILQHAGLRAL